MNRILFLMASTCALAGFATAAPSLPDFSSKTAKLPPLSLRDITKLPIVTPPQEFRSEPRPPPSAPPVAHAPRHRVNRDARMPILTPNPDIDYKMLVKAPDPDVDFKLLVKAPEATAASADAAPHK